MQRPAQRADRATQRRGAVRARRGDDARRERRRIHAVLGGGDPVGVDRLDVAGVRLAPPADQEALRDRRGFVDDPLRDRRCARSPRRLRDEAQRHDRSAREVAAGLLVADVDERPHAPLGAQHRQAALHVHARVAAAYGERPRLRGRKTGLQGAVDQQAPDLLERDDPHEILDVDAAVAQRAAFLVRLRDLRGKGNDSLEPGLDVGEVGAVASVVIDKALQK